MNNWKKKNDNKSLICLLIGILTLAVVVYGVNYYLDVVKPAKYHEQVHKEALEYIQQQKWNDAVQLIRTLDKDSKCQECYVMEDYASAMDIIKNGNNTDDEIVSAYGLLDRVDASYNGQFSDAISSAKDNIKDSFVAAKARRDAEQLRTAQEMAARNSKASTNDDAASEAEKKERETRIFVGDPESKIQNVLGAPEHVNRTVVSGHVSKQYVYTRGSKRIFVYTDDGIVTGFQD